MADKTKDERIVHVATNSQDWEGELKRTIEYTYKRIIVFCRSGKEVTDVRRAIADTGLWIGMIHEGFSYNNNREIIQTFVTEGRKRKVILIATDLALTGHSGLTVKADITIGLTRPTDEYDMLLRLSYTKRNGRHLAFQFPSPDERRIKVDSTGELVDHLRQQILRHIGETRSGRVLVVAQQQWLMTRVMNEMIDKRPVFITYNSTQLQKEDRIATYVGGSNRLLITNDIVDLPNLTAISDLVIGLEVAHDILRRLTRRRWVNAYRGGKYLEYVMPLL